MLFNLNNINDENNVMVLCNILKCNKPLLFPPIFSGINSNISLITELKSYATKAGFPLVLRLSGIHKSDVKKYS